ncbi:MAG TPA: hypothetical protein VF147_11525, partial [Vicinamibacterales bacterium]
MTKRSLYAHIRTALHWTLLAGGAALSVPAAAQPIACPSCIAVAITPGQALALQPPLNDLEVIVRIAPGTDDAAVIAVAAIREAGGRPGLLVDARGAQLTPDTIFALKQHLAAARGRFPGAIIGLAASSLPSDLEPYVDFVTGDAARGSRAPVWRTVAARTATELLDETTAAGADRWLWDAPPDVTTVAAVTHELARLRLLPPPDAPDRFTEGVSVVAPRQLSVEEIVARHQAAVARQAARVSTDLATGTLTLTFEAPGFPAPVTIGAETVVYSGGGRTELEQRAIRVNGIAFRGSGVPKLPIIEPERVSAPPLAIALTTAYTYRLEGVETIGGVACYVVSFDPIDPRGARFRGRAWIAGDDYGMVKVAAVQTGLRGPILASEQTDTFARQQPGVWLLARSDTRQMYEGAAHRTPIHRVLALDTHDVNAADFEARRAAAYASSAVMLRDTP